MHQPDTDQLSGCRGCTHDGQRRRESQLATHVLAASRGTYQDQMTPSAMGGKNEPEPTACRGIPKREGCTRLNDPLTHSKTLTAHERVRHAKRMPVDPGRHLFQLKTEGGEPTRPQIEIHAPHTTSIVKAQRNLPHSWGRRSESVRRCRERQAQPPSDRTARQPKVHDRTRVSVEEGATAMSRQATASTRSRRVRRWRRHQRHERRRESGA